MNSGQLSIVWHRFTIISRAVAGWKSRGGRLGGAVRGVQARCKRLEVAAGSGSWKNTSWRLGIQVMITERTPVKPSQSQKNHPDTDNICKFPSCGTAATKAGRPVSFSGVHKEQTTSTTRRPNSGIPGMIQTEERWHVGHPKIRQRTCSVRSIRPSLDRQR